MRSKNQCVLALTRQIVLISLVAHAIGKRQRVKSHASAALTRDAPCSCNGWVRHPLSEWGEVAENGDQLDRVGGAVGTGAVDFVPVFV